MPEERSTSLRILLLVARLSILAGIVVAITGVTAVVTEAMRTGIWNPGWVLGWIALGALPYVGGTLTGRAVRGPGNQGLVAVGLVTSLLGVAIVAVWVIERLTRGV